MQTAAAPNQCSRPAEEAGPKDTPLFGECMFFKDNVSRRFILNGAGDRTDDFSFTLQIRANLDLADALIEVSRSKAGKRNFPKRSGGGCAVDLCIHLYSINPKP